MILNQDGIFSRAENAVEKYNEAKAREVLETVLLTDGQYEKNINPEYNQDEFLDDLIKNEISGSNVKGDVAIIGKYAYELDRSVPKIGRYLGKADDLIFPTVTATEPVLVSDYRTASFTVTALEEKNGINKIEIWINGEKIETLIKTYNNVKTEITENLTVNKNGKYTIKAYGDLMSSITVEVTGIVPVVEFSPNGSDEWRKEHSTRITVKETGERVTSLKYKWTTSKANPPQISEFTENCPPDNIITGKDFTGTYYLWILLTTETGKTNICGSEAFKFDNEAPTVELTSTPVSETSFTLTAKANDNYSGIKKCDLYINGKFETTLFMEEGKASYIWTGDSPKANVECKIVGVDLACNENTFMCISRTLLYTWRTRVLIQEAYWDWGEPMQSGNRCVGNATFNYWDEMPELDHSTGAILTEQKQCIGWELPGKYWLEPLCGGIGLVTYGGASSNIQIVGGTYRRIEKVKDEIWGEWYEITSEKENEYPIKGTVSKNEYEYIALK